MNAPSHIRGRYTHTPLLIVMLASFPILATGFHGILLQVVITAVLLTAIATIARNRRGVQIAALVLAVITVVVRLIDAATAETIPAWLNLLSFGAQLLFLGTAVVFLMIDVLRLEHVTGDKVNGALCVYLLLGYVWAILFGLLELTSPGSFQAGGQPLADHRDLVYFSFVTLTTLGYGDISPVTQAARYFVVLEAVVAQMFLAVLVARLVGLTIAEANSAPHTGPPPDEPS